MKNEIILMEGFDGAGKSTLIKNFQQFLSSERLSSLVIDQKNTRVISNINHAMKDETTEIAPAIEILLRFAREHERMKILKENRSEYDYLILDRGILSAISWIYYYNQSYEKYRQISEEILNELGQIKLIYCFAHFEDCWKRVISRGNLTKKEQKGEEINRRMYQVQTNTFLRFNFPSIAKYEISTSGSQEDCLKNLLDCIELSSLPSGFSNNLNLSGIFN